MITKTRASQRGVALLTATIIIVIVAGMSAAFLMLSFNQRKVIAQASESELTLHIAEAGVEDAINKLQAYALKWRVNKALPTATDLPSTYDYSIFRTDQVSKFVTFTGSINGGSWSVTVRNNKTTAPIFVSPFSYDYPSFTDPIWFVIDSTATRQGQTRTLQVLTSAFDQSNTFKYGLFGDVTVEAGGTFSSDGFDSSKGTYAAQLAAKGPSALYTFPDGKTTTFVNNTGNLGSNGSIVVGGTAKVMGNATPGPGGSTTGGGNISGSTTPALGAEALTVPTVTVPTGVTPITSPSWTGGDLTIGSGTAAGTPTVYQWSNMDANGKGTLTVNGNVDIYIDGNINMNNQQAINIKQDTSVNPAKAYTVRIYHKTGDIHINGQAFAGNGSAKNFQIYSTTTGDIQFNGGSTVYAAVNAPKAAFTNNGGNEFYGSMVASTMKLKGNAYFHYDEDLANLSLPEPRFKIVSWRETAH